MTPTRSLLGFACRRGLRHALAAPALAAEPIKIGIPVGLCGANSVVAPSVVQSAELAAEEINAKGGILGRRSRWKSPMTARGAAGAQKAFDSLVFQKKVNVAHLDGDECGAQRRPADRGARQDAVHLHVVLRRPLLQPVPLRQRLGARTAGARRSSITSPRRRSAKTFFLVGSDYAFGRGMLAIHHGLYREEGRQGASARNICRWTARTGPRSSASSRAREPDALITSTAAARPTSR